MSIAINSRTSAGMPSDITGHTYDTELAAEEIAEQLDAEVLPPEPRPLLRLVLGRPLETAAAPHQTIGKSVGMAVFASDALSSVAYATEEILLVLAAAGTIYFSFALPIAGAISILLVVLTLSYRQTAAAPISSRTTTLAMARRRPPARRC
jgi:hypothetical protein